MILVTKVNIELIQAQREREKNNSTSLKINSQWWNKDKKLIVSNRTKNYNKKHYMHCVNELVFTVLIISIYDRYN